MNTSKPLAAMLLSLLILPLGCASLGMKPLQISTEVRTEPEGLEVLFRGDPVGAAPLSFSLGTLEEALEVTAKATGTERIERRIEVLAPDRMRIWLRRGEEVSPMAVALGLTQITVFDYSEKAIFDFDSAKLRRRLKPTLRRQAEILNGPFAGLDIYICGHTDSIGEDDYNAVLSVERAEAVGLFLEKQGVDQARVHIQGFGEDFPVASNQDPEGRSRNRRTEIILPE
ncbi:MAG: OmpA family protein [Deltaproteobacteria bacterium]|nr:OmpA family protein [Deltaproteobacteria bacterium]